MSAESDFEMANTGSYRIQPFVDHFYSLALEGHGDLARGRHFFVLHFLELAFAKGMSKYRPSKAPHQWLALLFDVVNDYLNGYLVSGKSEKEIRDLIQKGLEQTWQEFMVCLKNIALSEIATLTDVTIKNYLLKESSLKLYLGNENLTQLDINSMSVVDIFTWLPSLAQAGSKGKHTIGGSLLKLVRKLFSESWYEVIKLWPKNDLPLLLYAFGCLPLSGISLLNIIADYLEDKYNLAPEDYGFAVLYILATNSTPFKQKDPILRARQWQVVNCYLSEQDEVNFGVLFDVDSREDSRRPLELACLSLSAAFPQAIRVIDNWLEHCDDFPELFGDKPWHESVQEHLDNIEAIEASVLEAVIFKIKEKGK